MALEAVVYQQQQEELFGLNNYMINHNYYGKSSEIRDLHQQQVYPFLLETCWAGNDLMMMPPSSSPTHHHHDYNNYDDYNNVVIGGGSYDYLVQFHHDHDHHHHSDGDNYNVGVYDHHHHNPSFNNDDDDQYQHQHQHEETTKEQEGEVGPRGVRPKRRRARAKKNKEEVENQRMTHIAVERNRRKQMNDYLNVLRSLMPDSYVPRGDQASIIGGAINFVKELEQNLQCLSAKKQMNDLNINATTSFTSSSSSSSSSLPFGEFFSFPQYSTSTTTTTSTGDNEQELKGESHHLGGGEMVADVEVSMVETHALVKIRTKQPPKQLSKLVSGLQGLRLTILHLNATKVDGVAFYSFSVKVEDESRLSSVDEIASAVYHLLGKIQEGSTF